MCYEPSDRTSGRVAPGRGVVNTPSMLPAAAAAWRVAWLGLSAAVVAGQAADPSCPCLGALPNDAATRGTNETTGEAVRVLQLGQETFQCVLLSSSRFALSGLTNAAVDPDIRSSTAWIPALRTMRPSRHSVSTTRASHARMLRRGVAQRGATSTRQTATSALERCEAATFRVPSILMRHVGHQVVAAQLTRRLPPQRQVRT